MSSDSRNLGSKPSLEKSLAILGQGNFGVFTGTQAAQHGISKHQLGRAVARGYLRRPLPNVFIVAATERTWRQEVAAAHAWAAPNGVLSHRTAATLWRLSGFEEPKPIVLSSTSLRRSCSPDIELRRVTKWHHGDVCRIGGWATTTLARTLLDVASELSIDELRTVVDDALIRGLCDLTRIAHRLEIVGSSGRKGAGKLRALLDEFRGRGLLPRSVLERLYLDACEAAKLPRPWLQYPVTIDGRTFLIDFAYPDHMAAIEMDGWRFHGGRRAWEKDIERANSLVAAGWRLVRGTWRGLQNDPHALIEQVRALLSPPLFT